MYRIFGGIAVVILIGIGALFFTQTATEQTLSPEALKSIENFEPVDNTDGDEVYDPAMAESMSEFLAGQEVFQLSFEHVVPGEYSEIYAVRKGKVGEQLSARLEGPGVIDAGEQVAIVDELGLAHYTWKINRYGEYTAHYDVTSAVDLSAKEVVQKSIVVE